MPSGGADGYFAPPEPSVAWGRVAELAERAAAATSTWRRRAERAEAEIERLHGHLSELASADAPDDASEIRRLRAENELLRTRMAEAHRQIGGVLARVAEWETRREAAAPT